MRSHAWVICCDALKRISAAQLENLRLRRRQIGGAVMSNPKQFFTLQDLSDRWLISIKSVRRIVARGELKTHRIGNCIRISPDDAAVYERRRCG
jgi:hypothetical protein